MWKREKLRALRSACDGRNLDEETGSRRRTSSLTVPLLLLEEENRGRALRARAPAAWVHSREAFDSPIHCLSGRTPVIWSHVSDIPSQDRLDRGLPQPTILSHITTEGRGRLDRMSIDGTGIVMRSAGRDDGDCVARQTSRLI